VVNSAASMSASACRSMSLAEPPDLEEIFARYVDPVHRFLYARLGNREDAEDLTSEVFLKATKLLDPHRSEASIAQWLFTVARTVLADHWRRYYRGGASLPLEEHHVVEIEAGSVQHAGETERLVEQVLSALPDRYRRVLELRFLRGYSIEETAREMDITSENAKVIQHRALAKAVQLSGEAI
jgi:RNA polymerase sigma factor (sigma-70 family)